MNPGYLDTTGESQKKRPRFSIHYKVCYKVNVSGVSLSENSSIAGSVLCSILIHPRGPCGQSAKCKFIRVKTRGFVGFIMSGV